MFLAEVIDKNDNKIAVDLKRVTDTDPMIAACEHEGVDGVALAGFGLPKAGDKYIFFVPMEAFVDFIMWKLIHDQ